MHSHQGFSKILSKLADRVDLSKKESALAMVDVISGNLTDSQIAAFLVALRVKGESIDEILGFREAVMANTFPISSNKKLLDIVGTGGDPYGAVINVSSIASIVVAAAGIPVAKHGNKAATSSSGASDVLSALGINLNLSPEECQSLLNTTNITFLFAASFHSGFRHAANARRELGIPTIFNVLGPLCNPASPEASAVGVSSATRLEQVADVFADLGTTALVYRGADGIDKITTTSVSQIFEVSRGKKFEHLIDPTKLGIKQASLKDLCGDSPGQNAAIAQDVLEGKPGPARDIVALNAAGGLVAYELAQNPAQAKRPLIERLREKLAVADETIDSGEAKAKLSLWVKESNS